MPQAVSSTPLLYVDDSCILYQLRMSRKLKKRLNKDFENLRAWFVDNKSSIHFGEDKTKSILFASKWRAKNIHQLSIRYKDINIKQHSWMHRSNISWMRARRDDVRRANDIKSYQ